MRYDHRLRDWIEWGQRTRGWSHKTCVAYHPRAVSWLDWCVTSGVRAVRAQPREVAAWLDTLTATPAVRATAHNAVKAWFEHQRHLGKVRHNPVHQVTRAPVRRPLPRSLSPDGVTEVLRVAAGYGPMWACYFGFLAYGGLRQMEACQLRWVDIEGEAAWALVMGKGRVERMQPLHAALRVLVAAWQRECSDVVWIFHGRFPGTHMSAQCAAVWTRRVLDEAGFPEATGHWLRHAFGRRLVERGVPLPDVMAALGHRSLSSTTIYTLARPAQVAAAVAMLDYGEVRP